MVSIFLKSCLFAYTNKLREHALSDFILGYFQQKIKVVKGNTSIYLQIFSLQIILAVGTC